MNTLRVVNKPLRYPRGYNNRMMQPGETFQARKPIDERLLLATKRAVIARPEVDLPPPPAALLAQLDHDHNGKPGGSAAPDHTDEIKALREEYQEKLGKRPFLGWNAEELRRRIAAA